MSIKNFLQDEEGQSMVEYGVTLGAVAAVSYIAVVQLGDKTADLYAWMANHLPGGEQDEAGYENQVRAEGDGLVAVSNTANGVIFDSDAVANGQDTMFVNLGGNSVFEAPEAP
jgi:pilus assembly protein Flp/PilA